MTEYTMASGFTSQKYPVQPTQARLFLETSPRAPRWPGHVLLGRGDKSGRIWAG